MQEFPQHLVGDNAKIGTLVDRIKDLYEGLIDHIQSQGSVRVEKTGDGAFRFLLSATDHDSYYQRQNDLATQLGSLLGSNRIISDGNQNYRVNLNPNMIEGFLFLQFPGIYLFDEQYALNQGLPDRITRDLLDEEQNSVEKAFISYLGADTIEQLLGSNDPDERDDLLNQLQERVNDLCDTVNSYKSAILKNKDLIEITLHENFGLQITVKTDGKKSFYRQISENTKFLLAYHLHQRAENIGGDILLFDEPDGGFHSTAQAFVLNFLRSLTEQGNTVVLSTHSEYMIDPDLLAGVRIMSIDEAGRLTVCNKFTQATRGRGDYLALQPILDAIGLRYGNLINIRDKVVITEGITDMLYLRAFKKLLNYGGALDIAPARGDSHILSLIPLFVSQGISFKVIIDTGRVTATLRDDYEIGEKYLYEIPVPKEYRDKMNGSGIEDLFSKQDFRKLLDHAEIPIDEQFEHVSNSFYVRGKPAKSILAHLLYEKGETIGIEFNEETLNKFTEVLDFCAEDRWCTI